MAKRDTRARRFAVKRGTQTWLPPLNLSVPTPLPPGFACVSPAACITGWVAIEGVATMDVLNAPFLYIVLGYLSGSVL